MLLLTALLGSPALACGQTTHVWTALHAIEHLPDGPLRSLLSAPAGQAALISGTMFPDGGYSPLVNHPYGEAAHWEPFQDEVLAQLQRGLPTQAEQDDWHAFFLGLAAHGIGDQYFDAAFVLRSKSHDNWTNSEFDTDSDIIVASRWGGHAIQPRVVPYEGLVPLFANQGITVDAQTMKTGMASLDVALFYVASAADQPDKVTASEALFPWAAPHLTQADEPGAPGCLGEVIAKYWQVLDARQRGELVDPNALVLDAHPAQDGYLPVLEAGDPDLLLHVVFKRAVSEASVEAAGRVTLTGPDGELPVDAWMFYREGSNVLNVRPGASLVADADYTLTLHAGIETLDGAASTADQTLRFSTRPPPDEPDVTPDPEPQPAEARGCQTSQAPLWLGLLLLPLLRRRR